MRIVRSCKVFGDDVVRRLVWLARRVGSLGTSQKAEVEKNVTAVVDVVLGQQCALHLEQVLGVAEVGAQFGGDVAPWASPCPGTPSSTPAAPDPARPCGTA